MPKHNKKHTFLKRITDNEKRIVYNNVECKRPQGKQNEPALTTSKASLKKVMICIWWNCKGILYYKLLLQNQALNPDKYCSKLDQLKVTITEKESSIVLMERCCLSPGQQQTLHQTLNLDILFPNGLINDSNWRKASRIGQSRVMTSVRTTPNFTSLCKPGNLVGCLSTLATLTWPFFFRLTLWY